MRVTTRPAAGCVCIVFCVFASSWQSLVSVQREACPIPPVPLSVPRRSSPRTPAAPPAIWPTQRPTGTTRPTTRPIRPGRDSS